MLALTAIAANVIDMPFTFLTVFNVVRNQYFFLDDGLITAIPSAMNFVVSTYVMVELAEPGTEGITYGLLTTASNLGGPVSSAISNWLFGAFHPSLSDSRNYVEHEPSLRSPRTCAHVDMDTCVQLTHARAWHVHPQVKDEPSFRNLVAASYVLSYVFAFGSLLLLPLLPDQKADTQARAPQRATWRASHVPGAPVALGRAR